MSQLALYTPCEYLRYGSTAIIHFCQCGNRRFKSEAEPRTESISAPYYPLEFLSRYRDPQLQLHR